MSPRGQAMNDIYRGMRLRTARPTLQGTLSLAVPALVAVIMVGMKPELIYLLMPIGITLAALPIVSADRVSVEEILTLLLSLKPDQGTWDCTDDRLSAAARWFTSCTFVVLMKASSILTLPLILLYSRRRIDMSEAQLTVTRVYYSSFKSLAMFSALGGLIIFVVKVFVFSLPASRAFHPVLLEWLPGLSTSRSIYLWHVLAPVGSLLFFLNIVIVDREHSKLRLDRKHCPRQSTIVAQTALSRVATLITIYTWICFALTTVPLLSTLEFSRMTFEIVVIPDSSLVTR
jgi:hypothetical protein